MTCVFFSVRFNASQTVEDVCLLVRMVSCYKVGPFLEEGVHKRSQGLQVDVVSLRLLEAQLFEREEGVDVLDEGF